MNKQLSVSFLIIVSILILALKDSAGFIHTVLHYIPDNPWHQHTTPHTHHINPMEIHKYLQQKHAHTHEHEHSDHAHAHTHDVMDHFHSDQNTEQNTPDEDIPFPVKIDVFFQPIQSFPIQKNRPKNSITHYPFYSFSLYSSLILPPLQPPQA